jgi:hypothetical protein
MPGGRGYDEWSCGWVAKNRGLFDGSLLRYSHYWCWNTDLALSVVRSELMKHLLMVTAAHLIALIILLGVLKVLRMRRSPARSVGISE